MVFYMGQGKNKEGKREVEYYPPSEIGRSDVFPNGTRVRMKSGSQGWIQGEIVEYYDVIPVVGGMMYGGGMTPGYKVRVLEGKHKGEVLNMPLYYVEKFSSTSARGPEQWRAVNGRWVKD